jgi:endogenous inhibitor of DNA gyrase (YacG/DUF329 family)
MEGIQLGLSHNCTACSKTFQRKSRKQKYCSEECASLQHNKKTYENAKRKRIALEETRVSLDGLSLQMMKQILQSTTYYCQADKQYLKCLVDRVIALTYPDRMYVCFKLYL